jgi:four helix bundle protein
MSGLDHARSYRDLIAYQKARQLAKDLFEVSKAFPREEIYSLTDQMRRASRSVGAQIAEAWGKRRYERSFVSKLTDADGEQYETQHWIETAGDCGYLSKQQVAGFLARCEEIGRLLGGIIAKSHLFCGDLSTTLRESSVEYIVHSDEFRASEILSTDLDLQIASPDDFEIFFNPFGVLDSG